MSDQNTEFGLSDGPLGFFLDYLVGPFLAIIFLTALALLIRRYVWKFVKREMFLENYEFPDELFDRIHLEFPNLDHDGYLRAREALRGFLLAKSDFGRDRGTVTTVIVSKLWTAFAADEKLYAEFSTEAIGQEVLPTDAAPPGTSRVSDQGLAHCWKAECKRNKIKPEAPTAIPDLFLLDAAFDVPGGIRYSLDDGVLHYLGHQSNTNKGWLLVAVEEVVDDWDDWVSSVSGGDSGDGGDGGE